MASVSFAKLVGGRLEPPHGALCPRLTRPGHAKYRQKGVLVATQLMRLARGVRRAVERGEYGPHQVRGRRACALGAAVSSSLKVSWRMQVEKDVECNPAFAAELAANDVPSAAGNKVGGRSRWRNGIRATLSGTPGGMFVNTGAKDAAGHMVRGCLLGDVL